MPLAEIDDPQALSKLVSDTAEAAVTPGADGAGSAGQEDGAPGAPPANGQAVPACVMIMWGDGTVTTVRPPDMAPAETSLIQWTRR